MSDDAGPVDRETFDRLFPWWPAVNARRHELIVKHNHRDAGLSRLERVEYDALQAVADAITGSVYPLPPLPVAVTVNSGDAPAIRWQDGGPPDGTHGLLLVVLDRAAFGPGHAAPWDEYYGDPVAVSWYGHKGKTTFGINTVSAMQVVRWAWLAPE